MNAANEVQKELHKVTGLLLEVQRDLGNERGPSRARQQLGQARRAASRARDNLVTLDSELRRADRVVPRRRLL
jgi:hypothetical protein